MNQAELYHRTFLPDGSFGPKCNYECHTPAVNRINSRELRPPMAEFPTLPMATPQVPGPFHKPQPQVQYKPKPYTPSQSRFKAYRFAGRGLVETAIVEKPDQKFREYATPFEIRYSTLAFRGLFVPIVEDLTVVGHIGKVHGKRIFRPSGTSPSSITEMVEHGVPLYVSENNPDEDYWWDHGSSYVDYTVLTSVDGLILAELGTRDRQALEPADFWLLDVVFLGKGLADLGITVGRRIVKSLVRRTQSRATMFGLAGPTRGIAQETMEQLGKKAIGPSGYDPRTGMTAKHFRAFQEAAAETQHIAVVRNTSTASTRLIEMGCPGKPLQLKFHTDPRTGVVTAKSAEHVEIAYKHGYYVVDADGIARRKVMTGGKEVTEELKLDGAFWPVEKGQVIDAARRKPVAGDYDLMGVIDPKSMGRNIALHRRGEVAPEDITSPIVEKFKAAANSRMDMPRVLHGAQDQYAGFRGGATVFYPDGRVVYLADESAVSAFYASIKRETIMGAYPRPAAGAPVVDELAARRAGR